ncbi:MAG: SMI1/KNR4 family protein [Acidobacteria bacterium]|nr:SMI1/KNR4 family protein [Acidobacteriota bacterium]
MAEKLELEFEPETGAGPLDADYVNEEEEMIGWEFPPEFLEFLKKQNGGVPKKKYFPLGENTKVLERFLCLDADYEESKFGDYDIGVVWSDILDRLNDYLVPFAAVFAGDFLCFDYEDEESETVRVVLWNHDLSEDDEPHTTPVADGFEAFLKMLSDE